MFDACDTAVEFRSMLGVDDNVSSVRLTVEDSLSDRFVDDMLALIAALKLKQNIISHEVITVQTGVSHYN